MSQTDQRLFVRTLDVPSTASTTTVGTAFALTEPTGHNAMLVVAALESHTGGTLDVYLQDSFDGGTTWIDCAHFSQLTAASTSKQAAGLALSSEIAIVGVGTLVAPGVGIAAGSFRSAPWGSLIRIVAVTGSGTSGSSKTQSITFVPTAYASR